MTKRIYKRMEKELSQLQARINRLESFFATKTYKECLGMTEQSLLRKQYEAMLDYENYLAKRIDMYN